MSATTVPGHEAIFLTDLPNCVILTILHYLDSTTLYLLSQTCQRFKIFIREHQTLWRCIDARRPPSSVEKVSYCVDRMYEQTYKVLLRGRLRSDQLVSQYFYKTINSLQNIRILALESQFINCAKCSITSFPSQLVELSLKKTQVMNGPEFFRKSDDNMTALRVLILDECQWVVTSCFMAISKYRNLEILSLYKCRNLENSIAYLSLAGGLGFKKLKVLDARLSTLGSTLIKSSCKLESLLAIYIQNKDISYKLDYFKRKLAICKGAPVRDYYEEEEFGMEDLMIKPVDRSYGSFSLMDDQGLIDYLSTDSSGNVPEWPRSSLYNYPYSSCTCGYKDSTKDNSKNNKKEDFSPVTYSSDDDDDDDDNHNNPKIKTIVDRVRNLQILVANYNTRALEDVIGGYWGDYFRHMHGYEELTFANFANHHLYLPSSSDENEPGSSGVKRKSSDDDSPNNSKRRIIEIRLNPNLEEPGPSSVRQVNLDENNLIVRGNYPGFLRDLPVQIADYGRIKKNNKISLKHLCLRGFPNITNQALKYITNLELDILDVTYTKCTLVGIKDYLVTHPTCRVLHENFCVCPPVMHF